MKVLKLRQNNSSPIDNKKIMKDEFDEAISSIMKVRKNWDNAEKTERLELVETYLANNKIPSVIKQQGLSKPFYIIHPVLKFMAIKNLNK